MNISLVRKIIISMIIVFSSSVTCVEKDLSIKSNVSIGITERIRVLALIDDYKKELISEKSQKIMLDLVKFTEESDLVIVQIYNDDMPFDYDKSRNGNYFKLFGAFIIGNIEYQLRNKTKENRRMEGANMLYKVYRKIREKDRSFKIPDIINWLRKKRSLQLK